VKELKTKKRVFIGLTSLGLLFLSIIIYFIWYLTYGGLYNINHLLPLILAVIIGVFILFAGIGITGIVYSILCKRSFPFMQGSIRAAITLLMPAAIRIGKLMKIEKEVVESSFIEVNNQLVKAKRLLLPPKRLLLLLPHCLQYSDCPIKITTDVANCRNCGKCIIGDIKLLSQQRGFHLFVATGGTIARKVIKEIQPAAIIAVACERDLTSGIQDSYPLPVLGLPNERPEGPCVNTQVRFDKIVESVEFFTKKEEF
jgi:hypothetical protein